MADEGIDSVIDIRGQVAGHGACTTRPVSPSTRASCRSPAGATMAPWAHTVHSAVPQQSVTAGTCFWSSKQLWQSQSVDIPPRLAAMRAPVTPH